MVATAARIGFVMEEWRRVVATSADVQRNYGDLARESEDPVETHFDTTDDAQNAVDARQHLLSQERRRFSVAMTGAETLLGLEMAGTIPIAQYTDPDRDVDRPMLISEINLDLATGKATVTLWG
jgi:hypothetical protein